MTIEQPLPIVDPRRDRGWLLILSLIVISRLPFLWMGYGVDADAWRTARVALTLWNSGVYEVSRFPGYPLHEFITAPLAAFGGSLLSNGATAFASIIMLYVWWRIVTRISGNPKTLLLALAFSPFIWINSTVTLDYLWSLLFLLLSLDRALRRQVIWSGICIGIAAGFRPSNVIAVIPLLFFFSSTGEGKGTLLRYLGATFLTALLLFLPLIVAYGIPGWIELTQTQMRSTALSFSDRLLLFIYRTTTMVGLPAALLLMSLIFVRRSKILETLRKYDPLFVTGLVGVGAFLFSYLLLPLERSYLIPALPFLLLGLDRVVRSRELLLFAICLTALSVVHPDLVTHHLPRGTPGFNVHWGFVVEDWQKRDEMLAERRLISQLPIQEKALILTGREETLWFENPLLLRDESSLSFLIKERVDVSRTSPHLAFAVGMRKECVEDVRNAGFDLYYLEDARYALQRIYGYLPEELNLKPIPVSVYGSRAKL